MVVGPDVKSVAYNSLANTRDYVKMFGLPSVVAGGSVRNSPSAVVSTGASVVATYLLKIIK